MIDEKHTENAERIFICDGIMRFKDRLEEAMGNDSSRVFAAKCGLSDGVIRNYLSGKTYPSLDRLAQIASASGRSVEWFIRDETVGESEHKNTQTDKSGSYDRDRLKTKLIAIVELLEDRELASAIELFRKRGFEALMPEIFNNPDVLSKKCVAERDSVGYSSSAASSEKEPLGKKHIG
ncbi:helix-turn-helix domain-containing protein [Citrobacter portucalensis]|uniref:helix-turn-helix domain-containing protein n=1 Tax=Citrobacter portucalensis TaxID=1639133 RepID=UPI00202CC670|nr:helix-turn-helix transcriptional regulator [Citrobacter portucalensis]URR14770.1 helix-turn-helix domain-containing protein [Citrobacter portucalensis]